MNALLVLRNNYLVFEHYTSPQYHGRDYRHPAKSITKSVTSALVGIARGQGKMPGLDSNLLGLFSQYPDIANMDTRKQKITLDTACTAFGINLQTDPGRLKRPQF
jgi:hypothetical protein